MRAKIKRAYIALVMLVINCLRWEARALKAGEMANLRSYDFMVRHLAAVTDEPRAEHP
jgi:hypothetical protein